MTYLNIFFLMFIIFMKMLTPANDSKTPVGQNNEKRWQLISEYMNSFNLLRGFSGAILIAKNGEAVFEKAVGWQNVEKDIANKKNTRFNLGSGNKMFTAVAIAQLNEKGMLNYNDPVIKYLPDYPNKYFAQNATIHNLLTHTAGLGDYLDSEYKNHWREVSELKDIVPFFAMDSLLFAPGERFQYSNSGYIVLGLIIEAVSGQNYFEYIRENIYKPAGMLNTDSYNTDGSVKNLAVAYTGKDSLWSVSTRGIKGTSAGGGYSTTEDMLRFHKALQANVLLKPDNVRLVLDGKVSFGTGGTGYYGYGFISDQINNKIWVGHGGRAPGIYFEYRFFLETGYTIIMFSNSESGMPDILFNKINELLTIEKSQWPISVEQTETLPEKFPVKVVALAKDDELKVLSSAVNDQDKYWKIIKKMTGSFNKKDAAQFENLFIKKDLVNVLSNESVYNFMVKQVYPVRGKITGFHDLSDPVKIADSDFPVRIATFHLEDGMPGYLGFSLNEADLIDHFSLFVHPQLCPNGKNKNCPKISRMSE
ncbi:MAG: serine hydrolase [Calditrichae bacterium]|nr:serine hydrolase [Calditrichia bacterium]